jgi:large-conductance mechanosensitive channel
MVGASTMIWDLFYITYGIFIFYLFGWLFLAGFLFVVAKSIGQVLEQKKKELEKKKEEWRKADGR